MTKDVPPPAADQSPYRWIVLGVATFAQAATCFLVQGLGALGGFIQADLNLNAAQIGLLMSAAQLLPIVGLLIAGEMLDRFNERWVVGLGAILVAGLLAVASLATSYGVLLFWLVMVGGAYSSAQPGGSKSVSGWFSSSQRGLAMGIRQAGLPLGGALSAASLPFVASHFSWHGGFLLGAVMAFLGGAVFIALYRPPHRADVITTAHGRGMAWVDITTWLRDRFGLLRLPVMRTIILSGVTLVTAQYAVLMFLPLDLRDRLGLPMADAAAYLSYALFAGVAGRIVLAAWSDRTAGGRFVPVAVAAVAVIAGLLALSLIDRPSPLMLAALAIWLGFFVFGWYGPWVALVSEAAPPGRVGFALGLAMAVNQIMIIVAPPLLGLIRDGTGDYRWNWGLLMIALIVVLGLTRGRAAHPESEPRAPV